MKLRILKNKKKKSKTKSCSRTAVSGALTFVVVLLLFTTSQKEKKSLENSAPPRGIGEVKPFTYDVTFINPGAKRDGEGPVWRLVGPGSDSELIRPRCALRRGAACGLETRASIDSLYKLEESQ